MHNTALVLEAGTAYAVSLSGQTLLTLATALELCGHQDMPFIRALPAHRELMEQISAQATAQAAAE